MFVKTLYIFTKIMIEAYKDVTLKPSAILKKRSRLYILIFLCNLSSSIVSSIHKLVMLSWSRNSQTFIENRSS